MTAKPRYYNGAFFLQGFLTSFIFQLFSHQFFQLKPNQMAFRVKLVILS